LRSEQREARYAEAPDGDPELESLATAVAHAAAVRNGSVDALERVDLGPAIAAALAALPPHYRVAVVLVDVEEYTYDEAAEVLDVAIGTVRSRLFRGRRLLQDRLYEHALDAGFSQLAPRTEAARPPRSATNRDLRSCAIESTPSEPQP
ncbi:MAG TPA: sigma factor-like helix-turn-helix DNA-binding protein, partial [Gemmatimonadaceae bacterium]|nr:sigma factor-like helix-turn-helix DNA-binding protein [Gemmatimonadaceae bacterium]